ncbi:MAG: hypothetical protein JST06_10165 [Bacteroidetes bacterium]|nr:hypothetical protein [Bacteroidota bacterium]
MEAAQYCQLRATEAAQKFLSDSLALEKDSSGKAAMIAAQTRSRMTRDSLERAAQVLLQEASEARDRLMKQVGINPATPTPNGSRIGIVLICIMCGFSLILLMLFCLAIRKQGFSFRDALSENMQDKLCIPNPEYKAESLKNWLMDWSNTTLIAAQKNRDAAEDALNHLLTKYSDENARTEAQKLEISTARQAKDSAQASYDEALKSGNAGPGMAALANLARLFPPTIEVSATGINIQALQVFEAARKARLAEEAHAPVDPQKVEAARQAEDAAFNALSNLEVPELRASISRLIAFVSAMLLLTVGLASACFFFYFYLVNGLPPDLSALPAVLLALGIGMVPYAVNKVAVVASKDKSI